MYRARDTKLKRDGPVGKDESNKTTGRVFNLFACRLTAFGQQSTPAQSVAAEAKTDYTAVKSNLLMRIFWA